MTNSATVPLAARLLGFAGLIPFVGLAGLALFGSLWALSALISYALAILAFMGGIHWGLAMAEGESSLARLGSSVVWPLIGWFAFFVGHPFNLLLLAAAFAALLAYDLREVRLKEAPSWYPALRWPLTGVVVVCLVLGMFAS
ncbi:MAG: DUF3429 domain-containing protein [Geminicoccaceae bacterium]|nr:DUF3429 domain-containing protein [Geminicoccaceae bacterium]